MADASILYKNTLKEQIDKHKFNHLESEVLKLYDTFNLKNPIEIMDFIKKNPKFIDFFNDIKPLLYEYYPLREYSLEYTQDPECSDLEQLFIRMKTEFKEDNVDLIVDNWREFSRKLRSCESKHELWCKVVTEVF